MIASHLRLASALRISNVWLLDDGQGRRFLIDTGHPLERPALRASLRRAGVRSPTDLTAVLLTHRHSDHAGNAAWLRRAFRCPVICHADDAPFLSGTLPPPRLARGLAPFYQEVLNRVEDRFPARCAVDEVYAEGAWRWGFTAVPTPGHTEGSAMLYHEPTRTLFSGDTVLASVPPWRFFERLSPVMPGFSLDARACRAALLEFLNAPPPIEFLCSGHGPLVRERTREKLLRLAQRMQEEPS